MRAARLQDALERLITAIRDVESELPATKSRTRPARVAHLCFPPPLSKRRRYEKRKAPRDDRPAEIQYRLRAWLSQEPRRMGAPHGSSSQTEAVNDSTTYSGFAESTGSRLAIKNAYSHRILSD